MIAGAEEVINCGDAGQEGELIQRWVMQKALCKCPVKRLWISSLTEESIREGFNSLKDNSEFQRLYEAGLARAIGDLSCCKTLLPHLLSALSATISLPNDQ